MAKKILFVFPSFNIGGTTVSVRNLMSLLSKDGYDCWLMPLNAQGVLIHLYDDVKQVKTPFFVRALSVSGWKKMPTLSQKIGAAFFRFLCKRFQCFESLVIGKSLNKIIRKYHFDTVVACQEAVTTKIVSYAHHDNKVAWVRCDYKRRIADQGIAREPYYKCFKAIVCVSDQTCESFKEVFPEYVDKTYCIANPQDSDLIISRADNDETEPRFTTSDNTIVSIGRLDAIKRFDQIAPIARKLKEHGLKFHWYLIGDGAERERIKESIVENKVEENVIMLGAKTNPFFYIKRADALVCLSRSEACPRVVNEAKILHTPTLSTDYPSIYEFILDGETGIISTIKDMPDAIMRLFADDVLRERINSNISGFEFDNTDLMCRIKGIL